MNLRRWSMPRGIKVTWYGCLMKWMNQQHQWSYNVVSITVTFCFVFLRYVIYWLLFMAILMIKILITDKIHNFTSNVIVEKNNKKSVDICLSYDKKSNVSFLRHNVDSSENSKRRKWSFKIEIELKIEYTHRKTHESFTGYKIHNICSYPATKVHKQIKKNF